MELSITRGPNEPVLSKSTIGDALKTTAKQNGEQLALVVPYQNIRWSWAKIDSYVDALATGFIVLGLKKGDRLGIWAQNCWEWLITQFATARLGIILVNVNPAYRAQEVEYVLNTVECRAIICAPRFKTSDYIGMLDELGPSKLPHLKIRISLGPEQFQGFIPFSSLLNNCDEAAVKGISATLRKDDAINIQFTSGTTGSPKGATLTHNNILNNGYMVGHQIGLSSNDRVCIPVPLYHCFGMVMGNLACLNHRATIVYPSEIFDPIAVLSTIANERCTAIYGVPTMFIQLLNSAQFNEFDLSSLRTGIMAGSPCPKVIMETVIEKMHVSEMTIAYGMTETSPVSFQTSRDDPVHERVSTVGRIQPHLEVKIVDSSNTPVPMGKAGEICVRGYSVMRGYWNDSNRTAEAIDLEGWMHTGDIGLLDEKGYCHVTGRLKDMIIRGGENIYPREIEEFLLRHPDITDVQVIGIPDDKYGEEVCACVILQPGAQVNEEGIRAFCQNKIAHYKIPRFIKFLDAFPMTITGKVQKFILRESVAADYELLE